MATQLYLTRATQDWASGNNDAKIDGTVGSRWQSRLLSTTPNEFILSSETNTVTGPTDGIEAVYPFGFFSPFVWISPPLATAGTISGAITWNLWGFENLMTANVAINGLLEVIDGATGAFTLVDKTARTTELSTSTTLNNFSETPVSGIACKKGDRLRVRIFGDDAGVMASGAYWRLSYGGVVGAEGDSWVSLTENFTFVSEPAGSQIFLTNTASSVATASVDLEAWTTRGSSNVISTTNSVSGWTTPLQVTNTAGGTVIDWFTKPLATFTLAGAARCNINNGSGSSAARSARIEISIVNNDGTNPVTWGATTDTSNSATFSSFLVSGNDVVISEGQRLRIRALYDDAETNGPMVTGDTLQLLYNGPTSAANGDSFVIFSQTLVESGGVVTSPHYPYVGAGYYP